MGLVFSQYTIPMRTGATAINGGGSPVLTYAQGGTPATGSANVVSCATTGSVASGDLLVMLSKYQGTAASMAVSTASGPAVTWTDATALFNSNPGFSASVAWGIAPTAGIETATATWTGGTDGGFLDCTIADFHSTTGWNATPLDVQVSIADNSGGTTACVPGTTAATTNAHDLVVGACFNFNSAQTYGAVAGYTFQTASSRNTTALYWKSVSTVGTQTISVPIAPDVFTGFILTFKAD